VYNLKYRPKTLDEIVGNRGIVESLNALFQSPTIPHSFMFSGQSGAGKTTLARIIASKLGCFPTELREINASDTRGIDTVRQIISESRFTPMLGRIKVYILDECQNLTGDAQNSLLKVLEEPPASVIFILCTTAPEKILSTIKTRCLQFIVSPLTDRDMLFLLNKVMKAESLTVPNDIIAVILELSEGIPRSALNLLEMLKDITDLDTALDIASKEHFARVEVVDICKAIIKQEEWESLMKKFTGIKEIDYEKMRIMMAGYFGGCLQRARSYEEMKFFSALLELFLPPISYVSAKNDLLYRISKSIHKHRDEEV